MSQRGRSLLLAGLVAGAATAFVLYRNHQAHRWMEWSGTVEARSINVGSRQGGRVKEVLAREGDLVKASQELIILEPGDLEGQRLQAEGQLEQVEANLAKLAYPGASARGEEIAGARARLQVETVAVQKATRDLSRARKLFKGGAATQTDHDDSRSTLRNAAAQRDALRAQLEQLMISTPSDVKAAQGQVDAAKGRLQQLEAMFAELTVRTPLDARVETLDLRPGDILPPNATAAKLLEPDQLYVRIYVPETMLAFIHPGQELSVYVDSFPERAFKAVVESISSQGEFTPRNLQTADERADQVFAARLSLREGQALLRAGMAAITRVSR